MCYNIVIVPTPKEWMMMSRKLVRALNGLGAKDTRRALRPPWYERMFPVETAAVRAWRELRREEELLFNRIRHTLTIKLGDKRKKVCDPDPKN